MPPKKPLPIKTWGKNGAKRPFLSLKLVEVEAPDFKKSLNSTI